MVLAGALRDFLPTDLNFSGGFGIAGVLAVLFPYFEKIILSLFDFSVTDYFGKLFGQNSFLGTGFGIVGIGAGITALQNLWNRGWAIYSEYFSISLEIPSSDGSYWDVLEWVHERQMKNPKHLSLQTENKQTSTGQWENVHEFLPSVGTHKFKFDGVKFSIERKRSDKTEDVYSVNRLENLVLSANHNDTSVFRNMLQAVKQFKDVKNEGRTTIWTATGNCWQNSNGKRKRPLDSVILDNGVGERILADVQDFIDSAKWYSDFGVPYRRGYLLFGPPGTGKTSFVAALAGHFDLNVCILNLSDKSLNDENLNQLLLNAPESSLILLEDVDAAFGNREDPVAKIDDSHSKPAASSTAFEGMNRLTFSGLLNALDGVASAEGRILFMTTNYVDRLDSALIRPGRVDCRQFIGFATKFQVDRMFRRFYKSATDDEVARFVHEIFHYCTESPEISLAKLQGLFLTFKNNPGEVFTGISGLFEPIEN